MKGPLGFGIAPTSPILVFVTQRAIVHYRWPLSSSRTGMQKYLRHACFLAVQHSTDLLLESFHVVACYECFSPKLQRTGHVMFGEI